MSKTDKNFLLDLFQHVPPSHVALFLRLIRLYPMNIVDDSMEREQTILAIINETTGSDYKTSIWPEIMSISRIPELLEQVLLMNEHERLLLAIEKLQSRFELQPHRFRLYQLLPTIKKCILCQNALGEPKFDEICNIIGRNDVYHGVLYKNECCDMIYRYGHTRNRRTRERLVRPDAIFKQEFIHLFDHLIYERLMIISFTNLVNEAASNFLSYTNATNADINQNRNFNNRPLVKNKLQAKYFAAVRTYKSLLKNKDVFLFVIPFYSRLGYGLK